MLTTTEDCRKIIRANLDGLDFSDNVLAFFGDEELEETPKADHPAFRNCDWISLLSSDDLCRIAGESATRLGFHVVVDNSYDDWEYREAETYLLNRLQELRQRYPRVCLLSAGARGRARIGHCCGIGTIRQFPYLQCSGRRAHYWPFGE